MASASVSPKLASNQSLLPFDFERLDHLDRESVVRRISSITRRHGVSFENHRSQLNKIFRLLSCMQQLTPQDARIIHLVPKDRYYLLNCYHFNYVLRNCRHGRTQYELVNLSSRLSRGGRRLIGDVVMMAPEEVACHAATVAVIRNPVKIVAQLEKILAVHGLALNMRAPDWERIEGPTMEQLIARRDALRNLNQRPRPDYLTPVP